MPSYVVDVRPYATGIAAWTKISVMTEGSVTPSSAPQPDSSESGPFSGIEGPTLSSPSAALAPPAVEVLANRVKALESRLDRLDEDLGSLAEILDQLADRLKGQERLARAYRVSRYVVWIPLLVGLATVWILVRMRVGHFLP